MKILYFKYCVFASCQNWFTQEPTNAER